MSIWCHQSQIYGYSKIEYSQIAIHSCNLLPVNKQNVTLQFLSKKSTLSTLIAISKLGILCFKYQRSRENKWSNWQYSPQKFAQNLSHLFTKLKIEKSVPPFPACKMHIFCFGKYSDFYMLSLKKVYNQFTNSNSYMFEL